MLNSLSHYRKTDNFTKGGDSCRKKDDVLDEKEGIQQPKEAYGVGINEGTNKNTIERRRT